MARARGYQRWHMCCTSSHDLRIAALATTTSFADVPAAPTCLLPPRSAPSRAWPSASRCTGTRRYGWTLHGAAWSWTLHGEPAPQGHASWARHCPTPLVTTQPPSSRAQPSLPAPQLVLHAAGPVKPSAASAPHLPLLGSTLHGAPPAEPLPLPGRPPRANAACRAHLMGIYVSNKTRSSDFHVILGSPQRCRPKAPRAEHPDPPPPDCRLVVLQAAHALDLVGNKAARGEIAAAKALAPSAVLAILDRAIQVGASRAWGARRQPGQHLQG